MRRAPFHAWGLLAGWAGARFVSFLSCALLLWLSGASGEVVNQSTAKIQFMHYVAQYAVWPKEVLAPADKQFVLGVLGENPFGDALEHYFKGKFVKTRGFAVKFFKTVEEVKDCHMLFISASEKTDF